jgi:hypothetical protein
VIAWFFRRRVAGFAFQRSDHDLAELAQLLVAAFAADRKAPLDDPLDRQILPSLRGPRGARLCFSLVASGARKVGLNLYPNDNRCASQ